MFSFIKIAFATTLALGLTASAAPIENIKRDNSGQATYYSTGLGSCGKTNSDSDSIVAMNSAQYSSSQCGQSISITNTKTGQTQSATVEDECPGCGSGSLDLSPSLFKALNNGNTDDGTFPITWSTN